jgi:hypothetical protein
MIEYVLVYSGGPVNVLVAGASEPPHLKNLSVVVNQSLGIDSRSCHSS